jgi:hypothetical protein
MGAYMPSLLIEDLAKELGKDPKSLSPLELRKYFILIDWAVTLETWDLLPLETEGEVTPQRFPLSRRVNLTEEQRIRLMKGLVKGIQENQFIKLDIVKPDAGLMEEMLVNLAKELKCEDRADEISVEYMISIADYEKVIMKSTHLYSNLLTYEPALNIDEIRFGLQKQYEGLRELKVFTARIEKFIVFNDVEKCFDVEKIDSLVPSKKLVEANAADLVLFYLNIMSSLKKLGTVAEGVLKNIYKKIPPLIKHLKSNDADTTDIALLMKELMPNDSRNTLKSDIGKDLSILIMNNPFLRGKPFIDFSFKTFSVVNKEKPINRVIMIGPEDLANDEVLKTIRIMINNHSDENIVLAFDGKDILEVNKHNEEFKTKFTLNVIGHGGVEMETNTNIVEKPHTNRVKKINANLGPFRGPASSTGDKLGELVNQCPNINHLRITGCFTGLIREGADLSKLTEKKRNQGVVEADRRDNGVVEQDRRTFTMESSGKLDDKNSPFVDTSVARHCWNKIDKENRQFSMTVSPDLIEPDEMEMIEPKKRVPNANKIGLMKWKTGSDATKKSNGIKEICVTTPEGPKKHRLKK